MPQARYNTVAAGGHASSRQLNGVLGLDNDRRGAPFGRADGSGADIGAYEFSDTLFRDGLEPAA